MVSANPLIPAVVSWGVENGKQTNFWTNVWLTPEPLYLVACSTITNEKLQYKVDAY